MANQTNNDLGWSTQNSITADLSPDQHCCRPNVPVEAAPIYCEIHLIRLIFYHKVLSFSCHCQCNVGILI